MQSQTPQTLFKGKSSLIAELLPLWLREQTKTYNEDIEWNYFQTTHSPGTPPRGNIYIERIGGSGANKSNYQIVPKIYKILIRLLVSDSSFERAYLEMLSWVDLLIDDVMIRLSADGIDETAHLVGDEKTKVLNNLRLQGYSSGRNILQGIRFVESRPFASINQDEGGTVESNTIYEWRDEESRNINRFC